MRLQIPKAPSTHATLLETKLLGGQNARTVLCTIVVNRFLKSRAHGGAVLPLIRARHSLTTS
jgi:hypothetical protein